MNKYSLSSVDTAGTTTSVTNRGHSRNLTCNIKTWNLFKTEVKCSLLKEPFLACSTKTVETRSKEQSWPLWQEHSQSAKKYSKSYNSGSNLSVCCSTVGTVCVDIPQVKV